MKIGAPEKTVHLAILDYLNTVLPESHLTVHLYNNPRSAAAGAIAKRMGMLSGIPDLMIIRPAGRVAFIEVKKDKGRIRPMQLAFQLHCRERGIPHAVCRSIDDARNFIQQLGIETREAA